MNLELEAAEVLDLIKVLGAMPTEANAWPLRQKIIAQHEAQKLEGDAAPVESPVESAE
jgi:hypothetical protein